MKQKVYIFFAITILSVFASTPSEAGYYMKKKAPVETVATLDQPTNVDGVSAGTAESASPVLTEQHTIGKKQGFFSRVLHKLMPHRQTIPLIAYIILAILPFGWLGMGLNDNFTGIDWIISLVLYILFWLPGFIYTLIMMGKYY